MHEHKSTQTHTQTNGPVERGLLLARMTIVRPDQLEQQQRHRIDEPNNKNYQ